MGTWEYLFRWSLAAVLAAASVWLLWKGLRRMLFANPELNWRPIEGRVIRSTIDERNEGEGKTYHALVEYLYTVDDIRYMGDRIAPLRSLSDSRRSAELDHRRYPRGSVVTVYVNPRNPSQSVLEPGNQSLRAFGYVVLGFLAGLASYGIVISSSSPD